MSVKEQMKEVVQSLSENCMIDDVLYQVYVLEKINRGHESLESEPAVPHDVAMKEMREWLLKLNGQ